MIRLENVSKVYRGKTAAVVALDGVSLSIDEGEFVTVKGPSGSGKSTLLLTIAGMIRPTRGRVVVGGEDVYAMSGSRRAKFRAENIGFVFQMFHLVPYLSVLENVLLPMVTGARQDDGRDARDLLERLGLSERASHKPAALSTGERQRTAMARALMNGPRIILADEPTGNLDGDNAEQVMRHMGEFHEQGGTVVLVTHEEAAQRHASRTIHIRQGRIELP